MRRTRRRIFVRRRKSSKKLRRAEFADKFCPPNIRQKKMTRRKFAGYNELKHTIKRSIEMLPRCTECRGGLAMTILSVRLSDKRVHCDKTEERSV